MSARDRIRLTGLSAVGHHGVFEHERRDGQPFVTDVVLHLDAAPAAAGDDLTRTAHYGEVADTVVRLVTGEPVDLIETLAQRIALAVLAEQPAVETVEVTVHKPQAPIPHDFADAAVTVVRGRADVPAAEDPTPRLSGSDAPAADVPSAAHPAEGPAPTPQLAARPAAPVTAVLALGANLGDVEETLDAAVAVITVTPDVHDVRASPRALTAPVGGPPGQKDYLNQVLTIRTTLAPWELLQLAHRLEQEHHRRRTVHWGSRTLDVDVIAYGDLTSDHPDLTLPHPRAAERAFVLLPWLWLDPEATLAGVPVAELAARAPDAAGVRRRPPRRDHLLASDLDRPRRD